MWIDQCLLENTGAAGRSCSRSIRADGAASTGVSDHARQRIAKQWRL
jgi:hypothetical protein